MEALMTIISKNSQLINKKDLSNSFNELNSFIKDAAKKSVTAHEVETAIWKMVLKIGKEAMGNFFSMLGSGDLGDKMQLPSGKKLVKFKNTSSKSYMTIFGEFNLNRSVYGTREKQRIECIPLDARLKLPDSKFSYLLQDWDLSFAVENSFNSTNKTINKILGLTQSVDSLERMNYKMSLDVDEYRDQKKIPSEEEEGAIFVVSADGKGIPMRKEENELRIENHRKKGIKNNKKKMATVGTAYTIDPLIRTPEDVVKSLFSKGREKNSEGAKDRPHAQNKNVYASLTYEMGGSIYESSDVVFSRLRDETVSRNSKVNRPFVLLMDGQESLWTKAGEYFPEGAIQILDLLHVTPRLWQAAHLFCEEGSKYAIDFVKARLLKILQGDVLNMVKGLKKMGTMNNFKGTKKESLEKICNYLVKNQDRLRYDVYLANGLPIASGVIEGACRYYVKDRMERSGMRWSIDGAQAMLDVRSVHLNGDWDDYLDFKRRKEGSDLYANMDTANDIEWPLAG